MHAVRAVLVPLAAAILFWVAMPGVSFVAPGHLSNTKSRAKFEKRWGEPWTTINATAGQLERVRDPIAKTIGAFQPVFRISQSWHLYRDGPSRTRRMEVWVDGALQYRSGDPEYAWRAPVFQNRRIRPMAESLVIRPGAKNRIGLGRAIVNYAQADFPGIERIEIRSTWARRNRPATVHHTMTAAAPDWALVDSP